ncbi:MAG: bifunctional DNA primase/polymerase [Methylococcales bacterium]|nr:bifunctional DNA primase/polymerase [Methylococcales bacterium]
MDKIQNYALGYTALGWPVLPLHWITAEGVCSCGKLDCHSPGKHPLVRNGVKDATLDPTQIQNWLKKWPNANIGIATGAVSGVLALDVDPRHGGDDSLDAIRAKYGKIPDDVMAVTGAGGTHFLFKYPGNVGRSTTNLWPGIDTRGDGGYIVVEPSNHISGKSYFWDAEANPLKGAILPDAPAWLLAKLTEKNGVQPQKQSTNTNVLPPDKIKKIRTALGYIPANDRDQWRDVGMALNDTGAGDQAFGLWCEWSEQSEKFNLKDQRRVWDSFTPGGGITLATIFATAKQNGWLAPEPDRRPEPPLAVYNADFGSPVPPGQVNPPPFPLVSAPELTATPKKINWLLDGILERGSMNLIFGDSGSGKSLFALDWAFCLASGLDWHGSQTTKTDVIIVAGEGFSGIGRRLKALEIKYDRKAPAGLFISEKSAQFLDRVNSKWVADSIRLICPNPGLVIIDTLHRNMEGDENSSQDIGCFINNLDTFLKPLGVAVLIVHHSGHGEKQRSRGSSSIRAAMDGEFGVEKSDIHITLSCHKAKDFEPFHPAFFSLQTIPLDWLDDDDEPLTSVILEQQTDAKRYTTKQPKLNSRDRAILSSLVDAIAAHGVDPTKEISEKFGGCESQIGFKVVYIDYWRERAYKLISIDGNQDDIPKMEDAKRKAFHRCRNKLLDSAFTFEFDNYAWPRLES